MAEILREKNLFHLRNEHISYALCEMPGGILAHLYSGPRLSAVNAANLLRHAGVASDGSFSVQECMLDRLPQEYPAFGLGDYREGAVMVVAPDGSRAVDLRLASAEVLEGKPALEGLPATRAGGCATLRLTLRDGLTGLEAELCYTIFDDCDSVARSVRLVNGGSAALTVTRAFSLCLDLPDADWELITLSGSWARERDIVRRPLCPGVQGVFSRRGASSHQASPFMALVRPDAGEARGEVFGLSLIYSGSFAARADVSQFGTARVLMGIDDADFAWRLEPGEAFQAPEAVMVFSEEGLGGMSRQFHRLWNARLLPERWAKRPRPVLLNSWEAAYFDFDADKLVAIAEAAAKAGVELFVMDDGWFGRRNDDTTSLGDWFTDLRKLPDGLKSLGDQIRALGLQFGIWMEPEMISPESELYRAHPDWCLHIPGREGITARHQFVLDMGREDVQAYVCEAVTRTLRESGAAYLKWDMNRNITNIGSAALPPERQGEVPHRYILGLYAVMRRLTEAFPEVLFEGCAGGGGRFDAGILAFMPQFWCSDNTDALCRCRIQYATSLVFPPSTMGSHVSAVPNHQTGRVTPMESRFAVALGGCFGYELDPRQLTEADRAAMREQIATANRTQALRLNGTFYRLLSPFEGNDTAWMTVSEDRTEALVTVVRALAQPNVMPPLVRLAGLDAGRRYRDAATGEIYGGDELMKVGLCCPLSQCDAASAMIELKAVDEA
ncbi:MAG: alpha-galactosidase [Clostridia bacterium]|nr:alpha-galactosidase [Clostridia bacterium]